MKKKTKKKPEIKKIEEKIQIEEEKVPFDAWFGQKVAAKQLKFWQNLEIKTFFTEKGLSDLEPKSKYEDILKIY